MLDQILVNPAVQSGLLPLALAVALCLAVRPLGVRWGAAAAMGAAYLVSHLITLGLPPLPPVAAQQKLLYVAVGLLVLGIALDAAPRPLRRTVMVLAPVAALVWLAWPVLMRGNATLTWLELAGSAAGAVIVMTRLERQAEKAVTLPVTLVAAAVGTGVVALLGGSASILQLALAVAAATGGYLLTNWPRQRQPVSAAALGLAALVPVLAGQLLLFTKASPWAVALLLPIVFADSLSDRAPVPAALRPVLLGALCLVPFALAVAAAWFGAETPGAYTG